MGNMSGASNSKARLKKGSKVVYRKNILYKGMENSPQQDERYTVDGIFSTHVKLEEIPDINFDLDTFFNYFTELKWTEKDEKAWKEKKLNEAVTNKS